MTNDDPFKSGSSGGAGIKAHEGQLLLVTPTEYIPDFETSFSRKDKKSDAVRADYVVLDGPDGIEEVEDTLIFQTVLISAMKRLAIFNEKHGVDPATGYPKMVLGVLIQDEDKKKTGQSAPWVLAEPDDGQKAAAREYLKDKKREPADPFS